MNNLESSVRAPWETVTGELTRVRYRLQHTWRGSLCWDPWAEHVGSPGPFPEQCWSSSQRRIALPLKGQTQAEFKSKHQQCWWPVGLLVRPNFPRSHGPIGITSVLNWASPSELQKVQSQQLMTNIGSKQCPRGQDSMTYQRMNVVCLHLTAQRSLQ